MNYGGFRFDCFSLSHSIDALWTAKVFILSEDRFGVSFGIARKGNECKMDRGEVAWCKEWWWGFNHVLPTNILGLFGDEICLVPKVSRK